MNLRGLCWSWVVPFVDVAVAAVRVLLVCVLEEERGRRKEV